MKECCETCCLKLRIEKLDHSKGGCTHTWPEGYICLAFHDAGIACWMVGEPAERGMCECYTPKEDQPDDYDPCYECGGYGDDYSIDDNGELVWNCPDCPFNKKEDA